MESPLQNAERRLREVLLQLTNEITIFERLMYKNVNQHRRALYFRRLCQVRRDLRLLQSADLPKLIQNILDCFEDNSRKPSLQEGRKQSKATKSELLDLRRRLYGVARLLEQMHDPILRASSHVADLLGRTFFMPFALTTLAILARIRVLVFQCLHDLLTIFNVFSEWASTNKGLSDQTLPLSVSCEWDGKRLSLATGTHHRHESCTENQQGFVEDDNGRKYTLLESTILGFEGEMGVEFAETQNESVKEIIQSVRSRPPQILSAENIEVHNSTGLLDSLNHGIDGSDKNSPTPPVAENQATPVEGVHGLPSQLLCDTDPKARDGTVSGPKVVAYISVLSTSDLKGEKRREETPPLKRQKKDSLFDMLLGLGD